MPVAVGGLELRLLAALVLGTASAVALALLSLGFRSRTAVIVRAGAPAAAILPAFAVLLDAHPRVAAVLYGPALVLVASLVFGLSRPVPLRARGPVARLAQRPGFWVVAPPIVALFLGALLVVFATRPALADPQHATLTKTTTAHFKIGRAHV